MKRLDEVVYVYFANPRTKTIIDYGCIYPDVRRGQTKRFILGWINGWLCSTDTSPCAPPKRWEDVFR